MTAGLAPMAMVEAAESLRLRLRVRGAVQGVGFRPHVHSLATVHGLAGFVLNDGDGVLIEVEGRRTQAFIEDLGRNPPPLAAIDSLDVERVPVTGAETGFRIEVSGQQGKGARIPADAALCEDCGNDLFDPGSRFFHYPFVTCTHCGPRYTITRGLPYDRPQTALAAFPLCADCARDYADPHNRRHHAEALACPACGPRLSHDVDRIMAVIQGGGIVAVKGIGGFHLMADAAAESAVSLLRSRKKRDFKPFAVMVANAASVPLVAEAGPEELALLQSRARPIVVMRTKGGLAPSLAPGLNALGVMLPYAPLHHLMMNWGRPDDRRHDANPRVLVATSANLAGDPLITDDGEAKAKLAGIADLVVTHDRPIVTRADDSVVAVAGTGARAKTIFYRRARGYVPDPIDLGGDGPPVLALGAHLKATLTLTRGREAFVSQHVGSLTNASTIVFYGETLAHLKALTGVKPEAVVCDCHPDLFTTRLAETMGLPVIRVQHHAAHVAVVAAENRLDRVTGLALDGHGYGDDGAAWGGEALALKGATHARLGHLAPLDLPGGDKAARQPWRMALSALSKMGRLDRLDRLPPEAAALVRLMPGMAMSATTSLGRVFDAASALLGICVHQDYEGQAAMEMEALVRKPRVLDGGYAVADGVLDLLPLLSALADPRMDRVTGAEYFHGTLAQGLADWAASVSDGAASVALTGGCMMNRVLAETLIERLDQLGLEGLIPAQVPPNDGGLSLGQAYLARKIIIGGN